MNESNRRKFIIATAALGAGTAVAAIPVVGAMASPVRENKKPLAYGEA